MRAITGLALALAATAAACSPVQDSKAADAQIAAFHQKLNAGDFAGIYGAGSPQMKAAVSQDDMVRLFAFVHGKLGNFQSGQDVGWSDNIATGGHFLTITYSAKYDRGEATERFIFSIDGGRALLSRYDVNSKVLLQLDSPSGAGNTTSS